MCDGSSRPAPRDEQKKTVALRTFAAKYPSSRMSFCQARDPAVFAPDFGERQVLGGQERNGEARLCVALKSRSASWPRSTVREGSAAPNVEKTAFSLRPVSPDHARERRRFSPPMLRQPARISRLLISFSAKRHATPARVAKWRTRIRYSNHELLVSRIGLLRSRHPAL
jgi:hypothetical protein